MPPRVRLGRSEARRIAHVLQQPAQLRRSSAKLRAVRYRSLEGPPCSSRWRNSPKPHHRAARIRVTGHGPRGPRGPPSPPPPRRRSARASASGPPALQQRPALQEVLQDDGPVREVVALRNSARGHAPPPLHPVPACACSAARTSSSDATSAPAPICRGPDSTAGCRRARSTSERARPGPPLPPPGPGPAPPPPRHAAGSPTATHATRATGPWPRV